MGSLFVRSAVSCAPSSYPEDRVRGGLGQSPVLIRRVTVVAPGPLKRRRLVFVSVAANVAEDRMTIVYVPGGGPIPSKPVKVDVDHRLRTARVRQLVKALGSQPSVRPMAILMRHC